MYPECRFRFALQNGIQRRIYAFPPRLKPFYASSLGALFSSDCMEVLPYVKEEVVDTVFADPPFNLGKEYGENFSDLKPDQEY
jgi:site-specific DNA-methyltransferase (adenine-specific)